jgi:hypothetical protein
MESFYIGVAVVKPFRLCANTRPCGILNPLAPRMALP